MWTQFVVSRGTFDLPHVITGLPTQMAGSPTQSMSVSTTGAMIELSVVTTAMEADAQVL